MGGRLLVAAAIFNDVSVQTSQAEVDKLCNPDEALKMIFGAALVNLHRLPNGFESA